MNVQPPTPTPRKRSLLFAALAGCAVIALCVLLAGVAGAGTWFLPPAGSRRRPPARAGGDPHRA